MRRGGNVICGRRLFYLGFPQSSRDVGFIVIINCRIRLLAVWDGAFGGISWRELLVITTWGPMEIGELEVFLI